MKYLVLSVTDRCNFSCRTCRAPDLANISMDGRHYLDLEVLKCLPFFSTQGYGNVSITGGEPGLHPQFRDLIQALYDRSWGFGVVSNGSMMERYEFLLDYRDRLRFLCFSLDGATEEVHDQVRQAGSFKKLIAGLKWAQQNRVFTKASCCANRLNRHQVEDIVKLCIDLNVKVIHFLRAYELSLGMNRDICLSEEERLALAKEVGRLARAYPKLRIFMGASLSFGRSFCSSARFLEALEINQRGELLFCCDALVQGAVVGSLDEESVADLYSKARRMSAGLQRIRRRMIERGLRFDGFDSCDFCNRVLNEPAFYWELHRPLGAEDTGDCRRRQQGRPCDVSPAAGGGPCSGDSDKENQ